MRTHVIVGMAAALALAGCVRGRADQQATVATTAADNVERPLTIVGCLTPDGTKPERDIARSSDNPPPPSFTLVNVTTAAPSGATPGVSGTSGSSAIGETGTRSYKLVADKDRLDDLQRFANSRVEVSGLIVASTGPGTPDIATSSAVGAARSDVRRLQVKDVHQLEPTCGAPKEH